MSNRRYPPPYWRYLKARLLNLGKPSFWGTAIFLCAVGLVIQQYLTNPEVSINSNRNTEDTLADTEESSISDEDKAIAADIDNLQSLFADTEPIISPERTTNSQDNQNKTPLPNTTSKPQSVNSPKPNVNSGVVNAQSPIPVEKNIFVSEAENLLRFGATDNNQLLGYKLGNGSSQPTGETANSSLLRPGFVNQNNSSQNLNSNGLLPTGLNQSTNQTQPSIYNNPSTIINSTGVTSYGGVTYSLPTSTQPSQTFSPSRGLNSGLDYTQPSSFNNLNNGQAVPLNTRLNSGTGYIQPSPYNNLNNNQPIAPNTGINSGTGYIQPTTQNIPPNPVNNLNYLQNLPNQNQSTSNFITGTSPIIGPYTVRNPRVNPNTTTNPMIPSNYGNSQIPQSNFPNNNLPQGQNINGIQNNGYSYP
ncbi:hypothetical protein [Anabaena subtropica]|uniref:Uncharacterized protein n=1 Tax=Anabaena subtropica FACHB-260 TaxID=2692884 RepID=A0ABR8CU08_9NOST|nr:hypothetical protein [Anabaena subtropica]MBD2346675.1 hypothetical protein [Anabaena subtropica FACHB-260]